MVGGNSVRKGEIEPWTMSNRWGVGGCQIDGVWEGAKDRTANHYRRP